MDQISWVTCGGYLTDLGERFKRCFVRHYFQLCAKTAPVLQFDQWREIRLSDGSWFSRIGLVCVLFKDNENVFPGEVGARLEWIAAHELGIRDASTASEELVRVGRRNQKTEIVFVEFVALVLGTEALMGLRMFMR